MGTMIGMCVLKRLAERWSYGNITKQAKWLSSASSSSNLNPSGIIAYNSQSKLLSPILTSQPGIINWYICGPTVYDSSHVGHAWAYVNFDIMRRIMEKYFDLNVVQVMNITDIDDKIINKALEQNLDFKEVGCKYEMEFLEDLEALGILKPTLMTRVSDFMPHIIFFIQKLMNQGIAYKTSDGSVYFNVQEYSKSYRYGKLKQAEAQVLTSDEPSKEKLSPLDFALWKASKTENEPFWIPTWGSKGRPGWHIECSAMASHVFGSYLDLHSGGIDLLFPHHENEEAQCCAFHGINQWAGHWIHTGHLNILGGVKMSKSLKNTVTIKEFLSKHSADHFRMLCIISHYRKSIEFSDESIALASNLLDGVQSFIAECGTFLRNPLPLSNFDSDLILATLVGTKCAVKKNLANDFNTFQATDDVRHLVALTRREMEKRVTASPKIYGSRSGVDAIASVSEFVATYFRSLGFGFVNRSVGNAFASDELLSSVIDDVVQFRKEVRQEAISLAKKKDIGTSGSKETLMNACDKIRNSFKSKGIQIKDNPTMTTWTLTKPSR